MFSLFKKPTTLSPAIVQQLEQKDCGVACILSLIRYYGGDNDFENLRRLRYKRNRHHFTGAVPGCTGKRF
ncbi:cysteine peptidase family C39 domain-containing protein [Hydrotalea sp.]|uniref:cysteine peptidase family C39 domain-containing protein n=1 Tax=Hydrotalea sp. TaxID=2881279 RepID=UPI0034231A33